MKNAVKTFLFLLILFQACQRGKEASYIPLSEADKSFVVYTEFSKIPFIHTNGFEFNLTVESKIMSTDQTARKHPRDDYATYEVLRYILKSEEPELNIFMNLLPKAYRPELNFRINNESYYHNGFYLVTEDLPDLDSIILNNQTYGDVFQLENAVYDSLTIVPSEILYTKKEGIIQIKMSNNESYSINK